MIILGIPTRKDWAQNFINLYLYLINCSFNFNKGIILLSYIKFIFINEFNN